MLCMRKCIFLKSTVVLIGLFFLAPAQAHYLWLEKVDGQPRIYFGEYQDGLHEKSGGRLDTIAQPQAQALLTGKNPVDVAVERKNDHLALIKAPAKARLIAWDFGLKVKDLSKNKIGIVKPMYYARLAVGDVEDVSSLTLDIQPVGAGRLRVNFKGQPLGETTLVFYAPNQWLREYKTDQNGEVTIAMPWQGLYIAEVVHLESAPGDYQGDAYDSVRHVGTLTVMRP